MKVDLTDTLPKNHYRGEVELEIRDRNGNVVNRVRENNIIKIFAKEIIAHRLAYSKVWDPDAATGSGAWVAHDIDIDELAPKYFVFGASFDEDGVALDSVDSRFYTPDSVTGGNIPITLGVGADRNGGLINAIPIAEPNRPLKRVERVYWESSYQPAGTPLLQDDVRAINNVIVYETILLLDEYNGLDTSASNYYSITEVALVGGKELDSVGACECDPRDLFLEASSSGDALLCNASGTATISIDSSESEVDLVKEGDQIKIVAAGGTGNSDTLDQVTPYYLVVSKALGGRDITLDRVPVDSNNEPITGDVGILRDGFKIFSHRVLKNPIRKNDAFSIVCRWRIIIN